LKAYYLNNYLPRQPTDSDLARDDLLTRTPLHGTPGRFDFFAAYAPTEDASPTAELDELFKLRPIGFGKRTPLPLHWWRDHQLMYPNVSRLARDILAIPGTVIHSLAVMMLILRVQDPLLPLSVSSQEDGMQYPFDEPA
jgi:hypothetical protein